MDKIIEYEKEAENMIIFIEEEIMNRKDLDQAVKNAFEDAYVKMAKFVRWGDKKVRNVSDLSITLEEFKRQFNLINSVRNSMKEAIDAIENLEEEG